MAALRDRLQLALANRYEFERELGRGGKKEAAINHLEYLLSVPSAVSVPALRVESTWDSLRDHPRFQRLLEQRR
jgi:hypothetical protein